MWVLAGTKELMTGSHYGNCLIYKHFQEVIIMLDHYVPILKQDDLMCLCLWITEVEQGIDI